MRLRGCQVFLFIAVAVNIAIFLYLAQVQHYFEQEVSQTHNRNDNFPSVDYTVLILEFESFHHDLSATVKSFLDSSPLIPIIILSKDLPYPPLDIPDTPQVKVIVQDGEPDKPPNKPESFLGTKYVLIVQDGVQLMTGSGVAPMITALETAADRRVRVAVSGVSGGEPSQCHNVHVNLREWTLMYSKLDSTAKVCTGVSTAGAILIRTQDLKKLAEPFIRPFPQGLFIQAALRNWKVVLTFSYLFARGNPLFIDEHLRWKHEVREKQRLQSMYKRFGMKKVINLNGEVEWYGCNKNSARCFGTVVDDMPDYLYRGRWTPPCCLRNLRETAQHVFKVMESSGVKYWLEGGSLLGAARNGDIIPWDYDADIGIYQNEIKKCKYLAEALSNPGQAIKDDQGFVWSTATEGEFFRVQFSQHNHMHVDIFPFYERDGIMTKNSWFKSHRQDTEFPAKYLQPLTTIKFAGTFASAPNGVREFLELKFGAGVIEKPQYPNPRRVQYRNL